MWFIIVLSVVFGVGSADLDHSKFISLFSCNFVSIVSKSHIFAFGKHEKMSVMSWDSIAVITEPRHEKTCLCHMRTTKAQKNRKYSGK